MTIDPTRAYKVRQPNPIGGLDFVTGAELANSIYVDVPASQPPNPRAYRASFYCQNSACVVREVVIKVELLDGEICAPEMFCPACRRPLGNPLSYVGAVALLAVDFTEEKT